MTAMTFLAFNRVTGVIQDAFGATPEDVIAFGTWHDDLMVAKCSPKLHKHIAQRMAEAGVDNYMPSEEADDVIVHNNEAKLFSEVYAGRCRCGELVFLGDEDFFAAEGRCHPDCGSSDYDSDPESYGDRCDRMDADDRGGSEP